MSQSFAKYEVARARRSFKLARAKAVERGVIPARAAAGYDKIAADGDPRGPKGRLVPNADAPAIRKAFELRAAGASPNEVAAHLDASNVHSPSSRRRHSNSWSRSGVVRLLQSRTYLGEIHSGDLFNPRAHEPIIDEALFLAAQRPARPSFAGRESRHPFWLTRVARCAGCGGSLVGGHVTRRGPAAPFPIYRCLTRGCPERATISAGKLERFVEELLRARTAALVEVADQADDDDGEALEAERADAERELAAWRRLPVADLDPAFFAEGLRERRERLDSVLEQIGQVRHAAKPARPLTAEIWADWATMTVEERRAVVRGEVARVEVCRGKQAVPLDERVTLTFAE